MKTFTIFAFAVAVALNTAIAEAAECTVSSYDKIEEAVNSCTTLTLKDINVPAETTLELKLQAGTKLTLAGTWTWEYAEWKGPLFQISGSGVTVQGDNVVLDGQGALWWDSKGTSGVSKPKFFRIKTTDGSTVKDINILNCPVQCVSINTASDTVIDNFYIDVSDGDSHGGHNTDGFDVSSCTGITVQNSVVKNQDDCVAVNQGSDMTFKNLTCIGGHGLSLSVGQSTEDGSPNEVSNIHFLDSSVIDSANGIHIKTHTDAGTGSVNDVSYKNIILTNITKYGINVQEDYKKGKSSGSPKNNIPITNLNLIDVVGTMSGHSKTTPVYILCADDGCFDWTWSGISITDGKKDNSCNYEPSGFTC